MKKLSVLFIICAILLCGATNSFAQDPAQELVLPADILFTVKFKSINHITSEVDQVAKLLGQPAVGAFMKQGITKDVAKLGDSEAFDLDKECYLFFVNPMKVGLMNPEKALFFVLPIKGKKVFLDKLRALHDLEVENGAIKLKPKNQEGMYGADKMRLAVTEDKVFYGGVSSAVKSLSTWADLQKTVDGIKMNGDATFYLNVENINLAFGPLLGMQRMGIQAQMQNMPPEQQGQMKLAIKGMDLLSKIISQVKDIQITVDLGQAGQGLEFDVNAKPDTEIGKYLSSQPKGDNPLIKFLPGDSNLVAAANFDKNMMGDFLTFYSEIMKELKGVFGAMIPMDPNMDAMVDLMEKFKPYIGNASAMSAKFGSDGISFVSIAEISKKDGLSNLYKEYIAKMSNIPAPIKYSYEVNVNEIDGCKVDKMTINLVNEGQIPVPPEALKAMKVLFGDEKLEMFMAYSDKHVVSAFGKNALEQIKTTLNNIENNTAVKNEKFEVEIKKHQATPNMVFYMNPAKILDVAKSVAKANGEQIPENLPDVSNVSPVVITSKWENNKIKDKIFIPGNIFEALTKFAAMKPQAGQAVEVEVQPDGDDGDDDDDDDDDVEENPDGWDF